MTDRTITLRSDLAERLEALASHEGQTLNEVIEQCLNRYTPISGNWALAVAEGMEWAEIAWIDDPDASSNSRDHFEQHLREQWERSQNKGCSLDADS